VHRIAFVVASAGALLARCARVETHHYALCLTIILTLVFAGLRRSTLRRCRRGGGAERGKRPLLSFGRHHGLTSVQV